jgi:hypothetical protein
MRNKITSAILALVAFFVFALVCHERFYTTGNFAYQVAIGVALIGVMAYASHMAKKIIDNDGSN